MPPVRDKRDRNVRAESLLRWAFYWNGDTRADVAHAQKACQWLSDGWSMSPRVVRPRIGSGLETRVGDLCSFDIAASSSGD
jgi:hypothetical protein